MAGRRGRRTRCAAACRSVLTATQRRCLAVADEQVAGRRLLRRDVLHDARRARAGRGGAGRHRGVGRRRAGALARRRRTGARGSASARASSWATGATASSRGVLTPAGERAAARTPTGRPRGVETDGDARAPYTVEPPRLLADPNPIDAIVRAAAKGDASLAGSPVDATLAAYAAHAEQLDDVASALIEPLVEPQDAARGRAAARVAASCGSDPACPRTRASRERGRCGRGRSRGTRGSGARGCWRSLDDAEQHGLAEAVEPLRKLADEVPAEPEVLEQLARVYGKLGWRGDQMRALASLAQRFPDDVQALRALPGGARRGRARRRRPTRSRRASRSSTPTPRSTSIARSRGATTRRPSPSSSGCRSAARTARRSRRASPTCSRARATRAPRRRSSRRRWRSTRATRRRASASPTAPTRGGDAGALRRALAAALQAGASERRAARRHRSARGRHRPRAVPQGRQGHHPRVRGLGEGRAPHGRHGGARPRLRGDVGARRRLERDARARDPEDPVAGGHQLGVGDSSRRRASCCTCASSSPTGACSSPSRSRASRR